VVNKGDYMSNEAILFMQALEQCRDRGGMEWFGSIPQEVLDIYEVHKGDIAFGVTIAGVYVKKSLQYRPIDPPNIIE
jgi:hypothetical protein